MDQLQALLSWGRGCTLVLRRPVSPSHTGRIHLSRPKALLILEYHIPGRNTTAVLKRSVVVPEKDSWMCLQGHTDILVGVKAEMGTPKLEKPNEGYLEFFVDWSVLRRLFLSKRNPWDVTLG